MKKIMLIFLFIICFNKIGYCLHMMSVDNTDGQYCKITMNGVQLWLDKTTTDNLYASRIYNESGDTQLGNFSDHKYYSGTPYSLWYDGERVLTVIENNNGRSVISIAGNLKLSSNGAALGDSTSYEIIYYIYPDRFFQQVIWTKTSTLPTNPTAINQRICGFYILGAGAAITSPIAYYEDSGSETAMVANTAYPTSTSDYSIILSDELNIMLEVFGGQDMGAGWAHSSSNVDGEDNVNTAICHGESGTTETGTSSTTFVSVIDYQGRDGAAKKYLNATIRSNLLGQLLDQSL